MDLFEHYNC